MTSKAPVVAAGSKFDRIRASDEVATRDRGERMSNKYYRDVTIAQQNKKQQITYLSENLDMQMTRTNSLVISTIKPNRYCYTHTAICCCYTHTQQLVVATHTENRFCHTPANCYCCTPRQKIVNPTHAQQEIITATHTTANATPSHGRWLAAELWSWYQGLQFVLRRECCAQTRRKACFGWWRNWTFGHGCFAAWRFQQQHRMSSMTKTTGTSGQVIRRVQQCWQ